MGDGAMYRIEDEIHLFDYQEEGIHWIWSNWMKGYKGVLLADDMGLGKTVQALGFIAGMKKPMVRIL